MTVSSIIDYFQTSASSISAGTNTDVTMAGVCNIDDAVKTDLTFLSTKYKDSAAEKLGRTQAGIVFIDSEIKPLVIDAIQPNHTVIFVENGKRAVMDIALQFLVETPTAEISASANIHPTATIGQNVSIGSFSEIGKNAVIGDNSVIESNVQLGASTVVGNDVIIKAGTVIGGSGFGYVKLEDGSYQHLPHFGKVIIEDGVHIGSNTCIDRGSLSNTIIRKGVRIDNLVHIAHNVDIGENSLIIACSMIAGSVVIGKNVWVAPAATIRNALNIQDDSIIGLGSVVTKDVEALSTVLGNPAMTLEEYKQLREAHKKLLDK